MFGQDFCPCKGAQSWTTGNSLTTVFLTRIFAPARGPSLGQLEIHVCLCFPMGSRAKRQNPIEMDSRSTAKRTLLVSKAIAFCFISKSSAKRCRGRDRALTSGSSASAHRLGRCRPNEFLIWRLQYNQPHVSHITHQRHGMGPARRHQAQC